MKSEGSIFLHVYYSWTGTASIGSDGYDVNWEQWPVYY